MGGKEKTETIKSESGPPDWLKPYYTQLASEAFAAGRQVDRGPYPYKMLADPNSIQYGALEGAAGVAANAGNSGAGNLLIDNATALARGDYLNPSTNPHFAGAIEAALRPAYEQLTETALPAIRDAAIGSGAFGGDRHGIAEGLALRSFGRDALDTGSKIAYENYVRERQNMINAPVSFSQAIEGALAPHQLTQKIGDQLQKYEQLSLDEQLKQFQYAQDAPFAGMDRVAALLNPGGFVSGSQITTDKAPKGGASGLVQGGLGAAANAAALGAGGPLTAGAGIIGAIAGGLL